MPASICCPCLSHAGKPLAMAPEPACGVFTCCSECGSTACRLMSPRLLSVDWQMLEIRKNKVFDDAA